MLHRIRSPRARARPFEHSWQVLLHLAWPTWSLGACSACGGLACAHTRGVVGAMVVRMWQEYLPTLTHRSRIGAYRLFW
eukprot:1787467-Prymnesium_polylepis.1